MQRTKITCPKIVTPSTLLTALSTCAAFGQGQEKVVKEPEVAQASLRAQADNPVNTYYIDSVAGDNTNSGTSPAAPWQDFTNINGKALAAGEKLLIKRGSVINQELQVSARGTADNLNVDIAQHKIIKVRFQNHTPATQMRFAFTTAAEPTWDEAKCQSFEVVANDIEPRVYTIDMSTGPGLTGSLKQLRFDLASEASAVTGTCRIDYIWIDNSQAQLP